MSAQTIMTVEQFSQMETAETDQYELIAGEVVPLSSATPLHAKIRGQVEFYFLSFLKLHRVGLVLAEVDCRLSDTTILRPDISLFLSTKLGQFDLTKIPVPFAPDIAVEVLSPSEKAMEVNRKVRYYLAAGCLEVWLIDHDNGEVFVHSPSGIRLFLETDTLESPTLPGFSVPLDELFHG